jgi:uncharacterized membrane protein YeaQ/YmgE (transglycosylase-associated protein family)
LQAGPVAAILIGRWGVADSPNHLLDTFAAAAAVGKERISMYILWWIIVGLVAGALARLILPGKDPMSIIATILLGIAGSVVGGFVASLIWPPEDVSFFQPGGLLLSLLGAILLLFLWRKLRKPSPA